jgi:signal transduction histidine kinase
VQGQRYLTLVLRDVSERQRAELALRESNRQLKELAGMLQQVRESERSRIAREMHDELGQLITGIRFELRWLESRLPAERSDLTGKLGSMVKQLDLSIASLRRITTELHPLILDDLGLSAAAGWLVDQFAQRTGIQVHLQLPKTEPKQGGQLALAIFRIMQESLTNVAKYAQATSVEISLQDAPTDWILTIKDNGIGFDPNIDNREGFGLIGMRERATLLGGSFAVDSAAGWGTQIHVTIPVEHLLRRE